MKRLSQWPLSEVYAACQQTAAHFQRGQVADDGYCLELFRRAIAQGDQAAWEAVHTQYRRLVAHWLHAPGQSADQLDAQVALTFERFWRTLRGAPFARQFKTLAAVLAYLRKCAFSVRLDEVRQQQRQQHALARLAELPATERPDEAAMQRLTESQVQSAVRSWLSDHLQDDRERLIVRESYELDHTPLEILRRHPDRFASADEIYRIKERVLKRLHRSPELRHLFELSVGNED